MVIAAQIALGPGQVAIGIGESELAPVVHDFGVQPHLMAFADIEHGKTTLLRTIVDGLTAGATPEQVKIVLIDYRRTLLGVVDDEYLAGSASSAQTATTMMAQLATYLTARMPPEDVTPQQLRDRSWWSGPDVYVIVDDYDMVATASANPLLAEITGHKPTLKVLNKQDIADPERTALWLAWYPQPPGAVAGFPSFSTFSFQGVA